MTDPCLPELPEPIRADLAAIGRVSAVPMILRVICQSTGMRFAAVARVTEDNWTACAVQDDGGMGIRPGTQLPIETTLCQEARMARKPIAFDHASQDPVYRTHHTPRIYGLESYISVPIVRRDGVYFGNLCAVDSVPRQVSDERTVGMFRLFADLIASQLESDDREQASQAALRDARELADLREQFIAVLGHDLRNPLSAASAAAEVLIRRESEPHGVLVGQRLARSVKRMGTLIGDVMDFARGRLGGGLEVEPAPVADLGDLLRSVVQELRDSHPEHTVQDAIAIPGTVRCDSGRVQQLLSNLLGNALAHGSSTQPIEVRVAVESGWLSMSVTNQGEPIPADSLARVFEPYWRPAGGSTGGGLGLGLYICAQIVKGHGGTLDAASSPAGETVFTARLPVAA